MILMRLLSAGRAFSNIRDRPHRYKMKSEQLLPTFGLGNGNPAKVHSAIERRSEAAPNTCVNENQSSVTPNPKPENEAMNATMECQTITNREAAEQTRPPAAYPHGRWTLLRNPFAKKPASAGDASPVQTELGLESVKPVRNDLHDSDLEFISTGYETGGAQGCREGEPEPSGAIWGNISSKLFGM
jgi:hypothetical protein